MQLPRPFIRILLAALLLSSCGDSKGSLETPLALFRDLKFEEALPLFEQAVAQHPRDTEARTWLAETYRRLGRIEEAERSAREALSIDSCNSFAHYVLASTLMPPPDLIEYRDSHPSWQHLLRSIECDSTNGNAWMMIMVSSIWREKVQLVQRSQRRLGDSGILTPAVLAFGRWLLRTLPENAILFTNGDMDTYPTMTLQAKENLRPDVTIIEREWLNFPASRQWYREHEGIPIPIPEERLGPEIADPAAEILRSWADQLQLGDLKRPIAFAVTVSESFMGTVKERLQYAGPYYLLLAEPAMNPSDTSALRTSLEGIRPDEFAGPWVSEADYSPIRSKYTHYLAANVTESALTYVQELLNAGKLDDARTWLEWAENYEKGTVAGSLREEQIQELKKLSDFR